jgi:hypothetical protein
MHHNENGNNVSVDAVYKTSQEFNSQRQHQHLVNDIKKNQVLKENKAYKNRNLSVGKEGFHEGIS